MQSLAFVGHMWGISLQSLTFPSSGSTGVTFLWKSTAMGITGQAQPTSSHSVQQLLPTSLGLRCDICRDHGGMVHGHSGDSCSMLFDSGEERKPQDPQGSGGGMLKSGQRLYGHLTPGNTGVAK